MIKGNFPLEKFAQYETPFYYYDMKLLNETLTLVQQEAAKYDFNIHYALKSNTNPRLLNTIASYGFGADCVSGGEIQTALDNGFSNDKIVYAGVGKADWEINLALENDIFCFNVESLPELIVINSLAKEKNKIAHIALRINPEVDAHTHAKITTGIKESKFGINMSQLGGVLDALGSLSNVKFQGVHFHIGSQITDMSIFRDLAIRSNDIVNRVKKAGFTPEHINFGGGLGIDYGHPNHIYVADFANYFSAFNTFFSREEHQSIHFELGRSITAQCGSLISRVLYVKEGETRTFAILDAGFTELIRPALYDALHRIENLSSDESEELYDVVGPICESSDFFAKDYSLNKVQRGNLIAIRSVGAYGEVMSSHYNNRPHVKSYFSDDNK